MKLRIKLNRKPRTEPYHPRFRGQMKPERTVEPGTLTAALDANIAARQALALNTDIQRLVLDGLVNMGPTMGTATVPVTSMQYGQSQLPDGTWTWDSRVPAGQSVPYAAVSPCTAITKKGTRCKLSGPGGRCAIHPAEA